MSLVRPALNLWLGLTERRFLARATEPEAVRAAFERKARFWFRPPRGTVFERAELAAEGARVPALRVRAGNSRDDRVILYFHGGAYFFGSPQTHRAMLGQLSALTGHAACLPDYRLAPEHPFPAAVEDALTAYRAVLAGGTAAGRIVIGGDSAGGGLALALLGEICRLDLPRPAMCFAFSAWTDLTLSGGTLTSNRRSEILLPGGRAAELRDMYLQGADPADPRASPLFARFSGAGPVVLYAATGEILLDDTRRMASALATQGVAVTELLEPGLPHAWPLLHNLLPEARRTLADLAARIAAL